ncbi:hypothetical protein KAI65_00270 [Candidatus Parcubacteria bacterium]|nr:hypothetical protein [Candidatus Parcubacteria bacterium]
MQKLLVIISIVVMAGLLMLVCWHISPRNKAEINEKKEKVIKDAQEQAGILERIVPTENGYKVSDEIYPPHLTFILLDEKLKRIEKK